MEHYLPEAHMHKLLKKAIPAMTWDGKQDPLQWQEAARQKLAELIGLPKIAACACEPAFCIDFDQLNEDGTREIRFRFFSEEGVIVPCHLMMPGDIAGPLPTVVCLQGHSSGMHISLGHPIHDYDAEDIRGGDRNFAVRAVREGCCALAVEQRCFGESGGKPDGNTNCTQTSMRAILLGRTVIGERVWDVMRALDMLEAHFAAFVDTDKLLCLGNSGGGTTTLYACALEPRFQVAVPSCALASYADSIGAMYHCECNFIPGIANWFDMGDLCAMIAPRGLVAVNGIEDPVFPKDAAAECFAVGKKLYEAMGAGDRCYHVFGDGGHRFYADPAWPLIHQLIDTL